MRAADLVSDGVNKAGDALSDLAQSVGGLLAEGLLHLGRRARAGGGPSRWLAGIATSAADLLGASVKAVTAAIGGFAGGLVGATAGLLTLDPRTALRHSADIPFGVLGGATLLATKAVALAQVCAGIGRPRRLNDVELGLVARVFGDSIATRNVRVVDGRAGLFSLNDRPFVAGDVIYMKDRSAAGDRRTFVHECVHVWQNQHVGPRYMAEALASQRWGAAYDWEREAQAGKAWPRFGREAQAELVADLWAVGRGAAGTAGGGAFFDEADEGARHFVFRGVDRTELANRTTRSLRSRKPWRLSALAGPRSGRPPVRQPGQGAADR